MKMFALANSELYPRIFVLRKGEISAIFEFWTYWCLPLLAARSRLGMASGFQAASEVTRLRILSGLFFGSSGFCVDWIRMIHSILEKGKE